MRKINSYHRGLNRNIINNLIAGAIIATILLIINMIQTGCEQPELQQHETIGIDSLQTENKDSIENWDTDTTIYHSQAKPR